MYDEYYKRAKSAEKNWEMARSLHLEAFEYVLPNRETFNIYSPGQRKNRRIFDSTAIVANQQFANRIMGALMPAWMKWAVLSAGDEIPKNEKDRVDELLEDTTTRVFSALNHSNFYTEIDPACKELGIGTGGIQVEEGRIGEEDVKFTNIPLAELHLEKCPKGSCWRKMMVNPKHILETWPKAKLPDQLKQKAELPNPRDELIWNGMIFNYKTRKYDQVVLHPNTKSVLFEQSFDTKRIIVFRWSVTPGECYGRGVGIQMLPDIRTVNKVKQFILENAAIQMAGVYTGVDDGIFNPHTVRIAPGTIIPVASNMSANPTLRALDRAGDLSMSQIVLEDLKANIKKAFFADPLGDITDPVRTATENMIRQQEMLKNSGSSFGRLKTELLEPLLSAVIDILSKKGKIAPIRVDGREVKIRYVSPLAQSESLEDFQNTQMWLQTIGQWLPPEALMGSVRIEELPGETADMLGVPKRLIRTPEERQELANAAMEASQQMGGQGAQPV